jgi:hypothetical protein
MVQMTKSFVVGREGEKFETEWISSLFSLNDTRDCHTVYRYNICIYAGTGLQTDKEEWLCFTGSCYFSVWKCRLHSELCCVLYYR